MRGKFEFRDGLWRPISSSLAAQTLQRIGINCVVGINLFKNKPRPGDWLDHPRLVSPQDREVLKELKSDDLQNCDQLLLYCMPTRCTACQYRREGCLQTDECPSWDQWGRPTPRRFRQRPGVYRLKGF